MVTDTTTEVFLFQFPVAFDVHAVHANMETPGVSLCIRPRAQSFLCPGSGGLWRVIASQCPCTSFSVWTPGL